MSFDTSTDNSQDGNGQQQAQSQQAPQGFQIQVGERQFNSQEDVIKHVEHSQAHIAKIEQENAQLRAQSEQFQTLQSKVDQMLQLQQTPAQQATTTAPQPPATTQQADGQQVQTAFNPDAFKGDMQNYVKDVFQQQQAQLQQQANLQTAMADMQKLHGDNYIQVVQTLAKEKGMDLKRVNELAMNHPGEFMSHFGTKSNGTQQAPTPQGDVNASANSQYQQGTEKTLGERLVSKDTSEIKHAVQELNALAKTDPAEYKRIAAQYGILLS